MIVKTIKSFLIAVFVLITVINCVAQITETQAKNLAESNQCVRKLSTDKPEYLRFTRDEDFEDDLFDLQKKDYNNLIKAAYIFRIKAKGTFITSSGEILQIDSTGDNSIVVAVSRNSGEVFALDGCENKEENFQNLIKQSNVQINSVPKAESFGYLYYKLVEDRDLQRIIYHPRRFRYEVENYLFGKFNESQAKVKFKQWKKDFGKFNEKSELGVIVKKGSNNYSVAITFISGFQDEVPKLKKIIMFVDESGIYQIQKTATLFPINKK